MADGVGISAIPGADPSSDAIDKDIDTSTTKGFNVAALCDRLDVDHATTLRGGDPHHRLRITSALDKRTRYPHRRTVGRSRDSPPAVYPCTGGNQMTRRSRRSRNSAKNHRNAESEPDRNVLIPASEDVFKNFRYRRSSRRLVDHANREGYPSFKHAPVIANTAFQQVVVRKNQLFAGQAPYPRCFQTYLFDIAGQIIDD